MGENTVKWGDLVLEGKFCEKRGNLSLMFLKKDDELNKGFNVR